MTFSVVRDDKKIQNQNILISQKKTDCVPKKVISNQVTLSFNKRISEFVCALWTSTNLSLTRRFSEGKRRFLLCTETFTWTYSLIPDF